MVRGCVLLKEIIMEKGDIVRHIFSRTVYIIEKLTPKKAEVRAILSNGLSGNINMILQRNLEPLSEADIEYIKKLES